MSAPLQQYRLVIGTSLANLVEQVNELMLEGWKPHGSPFSWTVGGAWGMGVSPIQAMTKITSGDFKEA